MQQLQAQLDRTQQQISTGRRILSPSDDPIASARTVELRESLARIEQFERNGEIARNRLNHEESALVSVNDLLQRVRELALQANNDSQSTETRRLIAGELRERVDQLVQLANQRDGTGRYLFSGNRDGITPVTTSNDTFSYNGDQGQRLIQIGEDRQIADSDSGAALFFQVKDGNGVFSSAASASNTGTGVVAASSVSDRTAYDQGAYTVRFTAPGNYEVVDSGNTVITTAAFTAGDTISFRGIEFTLEGSPAAGDEFQIEPSRNRDMFSSIVSLVTSLESNATSDSERALLHNNVNGSLQNIDQAIGKVLDIRTQVGTRLTAIDNQLESNDSFELTIQSTLSGIEDLDYADALSRLSIQATTLEAAQQSFVRISGLSLFNYL